ARRAGAGHSPLLSVYIHLPFCRSLCYFCACNKVITQDNSRSAEYIRYLDKEIALLSGHLGPHRQAGQLHLGGGTPTFLSAGELTHMMHALHQHFEFTPDAEMGIEIDPRTVSDSTLAMLA